ncbi:MAG: hypothetical protein GQ570_09150 [Helicobacteraceae bacterium]|nr:hypothetical protein [Helicobacteraceae bacterium]
MRKNYISAMLITTVLFLLSGCSALQINTPSLAKDTTIKTLVVLDRPHTLLDYRLYYALTQSTQRQKLGLKFKLHMANPFLAKSIDMPLKMREQQLSMYADINASVKTLLKIKESKPEALSMSSALFEYIKNNPKSNLSSAHIVASELMKDFNLMIIEPTGTTALHPLYYDKKLISVNGYGANVLDLLDSTYQLMLIDHALKNNIPVIGMCHGAQVGYAYAGGDLEKYFDVEAEAKNLAGNKHMIMARENPYGSGVEVWNLENYIMTRLWNDHTTSFENIKYPIAPYMKKALNISDNKDIFINKEFAQSLAMKLPVPKGVESYTMHPLSSLNENMSTVITDFNSLPSEDSYVTQESTKNFLDVFKDKLQVVDFFKYKTLYATQYHPQYVYNDYDTSLIFDFYTQMIKENYKKFN